MADNSEDDYWNTSLSTRFDFDEEEDVSKPVIAKTAVTAESIFNKHIEECSVLPIHTIISRKNLELILAETDVRSSKDIVPPVEETIKNMFCNRRYVLSCYRSLEHKMQLLDAAVDTFDGNIILTVVLFLYKTFSKPVFINQMSKKETALKQFILYLIFHNRIQEILDLYMATGITNNARNIFFLAVRNTSDNGKLLVKLDQQLQNITQKDFISELADYKQFLQWQIHKKHNCHSPTELMAILLKDQYESGVNHNVNEFKKSLKISDFQEEWLQLNVLGFLGCWQKLLSLFITENWLAKKKVFKSAIAPEVFIGVIEKQGAPQAVLQEFLSSIVDTDLSLAIAKRVKCHKFVIDYYISQRDRLSLLGYKNVVPTQSQEYFYLENALVERKWKN